MIAAWGLATSLATALALAWSELHWGEPLYTHMEYLVLPLGAAVAGAIAASGYYLGGRLLGLRPTPVLAALVLLTSVLTFILIHYAEYRWSLGSAEPGRRASFRSHLDRVFRTSRIQADGGFSWTTNELDDVGYAVAGLQVLGFSAGGLVVYASLRRVAHCSTCRYFMTREARDERWNSDVRSFGSLEQSVLDWLEASDVPSALEEHRRGGRPRSSPRDDYSSALEVRRCPRCGSRFVAFTIRTRGSDPRTWSAYFRAPAPLSATGGSRRSFDRVPS